MEPLLFVMILVGLGRAVSHPSSGLSLIVVSGFSQELIRKLTQGQSAYWQGLVVAFALAVFIGSYQKGLPNWWMRRDWRTVRQAVTVFMGVLAFQAIVSFVKTGSLLLPAVGLIAYSGPLVSVAVGSWLGRSPRAIVRILEIYLLGATLMATGIVLVQAGVTWDVLKPIGTGLFVYTSERIQLPSGFFRAPEVASWHCATAACIAALLATLRQREGFFRRGVLALAFSVLAYGVLAAGRRKGILEIVLFVVSFVTLQTLIGRRLGRVGRAALVLTLVGGYVLTRADVEQRTGGAVEAMILRERGTGGANFGKRLSQAMNAVPSMVQKFGPFGLGLGTLTQGSRYFGADLAWGKTYENGPYRLAVELGVAGVAVFTWVGLQLGQVTYRKLRRASAWDYDRATISTGILAILISNGAVFLMAHQIFGDPFVFLWIGLLGGFALGQVAKSPDRKEGLRREPEPGVASRGSAGPWAAGVNGGESDGRRCG